MKEEKGKKAGVTTLGWLSFVLSMTYVDKTTKNIQPVSNLLCFYLLSISENPTSSKSINHLDTISILLQTRRHIIYEVFPIVST